MRYAAVALQLTARSVERCADRAAASAHMLETIASIGPKLRASSIFIEQYSGAKVRLAVLPEYLLTSYPGRISIADFAGKAALDFIATVPELDASKVGVYGWSMGSYWGPRVAAFDPRVKALVGAMGNYLQKDTIFKHSKPAYRANYMYMSNTYDEDAFDAMAEQMTLEPLAGKIKCPMLLAMGEYDELCPLADGERMFDLLTCPKEL